MQGPLSCMLRPKLLSRMPSFHAACAASSQATGGRWGRALLLQLGLALRLLLRAPREQLLALDVLPVQRLHRAMRHLAVLEIHEAKALGLALSIRHDCRAGHLRPCSQHFSQGCKEAWQLLHAGFSLFDTHLHTGQPPLLRPGPQDMHLELCMHEGSPHNSPHNMIQ